MYRIADIQNALMSVVGWHQDYNPAQYIDDRLTRSDSGLYFQDAHPLLTLENIRRIMPENFVYQYPKWNDKTEFAVGDKVQHDNEIYIATADNVGETPSADSSYWAAYNFVSDYLEHLMRNGIATAIQTFTQIKGLQQETRSLLERRVFFDGAARLTATIENRGNLVGFEIVPVRSMGVTAKIERIGLQMRGGTGTVRLYLFHSSQIDPIKTFDLEFTKTNGMFQWFDIKEAYLPYIGTETDAGGSWFLCYNQDELPAGMEALNVSKDWSREPCGTCNVGSVEAWRELTKYLQISPFSFKAPKTFAEFPEMWDIAMINYTNTRNYGLNVEISVGCDLTDFIIQQRQLFQTVIQRQVAAIALRTLAMNPDVRVNRNQSNASRMDILYELDGNTAGRPTGLGYELKKAYEALNIETKGLDRICLSCNNHGVRYRTV